MSNVCGGCGKEPPQYFNYCTWECHIAEARKNGGREHLPNGLPIRSITRDWTMIEHEHGDHPDYKFPVDIQWHGPPEEVIDRNDDGSVMFDDSERTHALLFADDAIALTLYECNYTLWRLVDGTLHGGPYHEGPWRLSEESLTKIREWNALPPEVKLNRL